MLTIATAKVKMMNELGSSWRASTIAASPASKPRCVCVGKVNEIGDVMRAS